MNPNIVNLVTYCPYFYTKKPQHFNLKLTCIYNNIIIIINSLLQTNVHIHVKKYIYIIQSKKKKRKLKQHTDKKLYAELI